MVCLLQSRSAKIVVLLAGFVMLLGCMMASVLYGYYNFNLQQVWDAHLIPNGTNEHLIITNIRVPAALIGAAVGASLAIAGTLMQALTKNPLADPSIFGINSGAVLCVVLGMMFINVNMSLGELVWLAFGGATVIAFFVLVLGSVGKGGFSTIKLALAGAAISAFASSITSGVMLLNEESLDTALFWLTGSIAGREMKHFVDIIPYILFGWLVVMFLPRSLNVMAMSDDVAKGLGQNTVVAKSVTVLVVVLLAGGSVALTGPIAFIGLMVPHVCRYLVGTDHHWLIPYSAVMGGIFLVAADTLSRFIVLTEQVPVGMTTALIGVPFLIYIARRRTYE
ncbi:iron ABC transporter permease [Paenibacillus sp. 481]|nr:iron ABC transporter permease [Paenibacillus sp. 481]UHA75762.1 iron ABC transporter permease [Paenibacillus sp. 481]